jgi:exodeoxyribonuclease VIII
VNDAVGIAQSSVVYGQPWAEYYKVPALGSGGVEKLRQSPAHFKQQLDNPSDSTSDQAFGITLHCAVLEPARFAQDYVLAPQFDKRTNAGKAALAEWLESNRGKIGLVAEEMQRVNRCADSISHHPAARRLLEKATKEISVYWHDQEFSIPCKARLDLCSLGGITDVKTTKDASREAFAKSIANYGYHRQAAHYWNGHEACFDRSPEFWAWIAVESDEPHAVAVYEIGMASLLVGRREVDEAYARYRDGLATGVWRGYAETIEVIDVPAWARRF